MQSATLPDGRVIFCVNAYEVDFSVHEIFSEDLLAHGLSLPADGVYLDVGANIGLFSLYLRDHCPTARLIGFEPMPAAFAALKANMAAMSPAGTAVQLALGDHSGWAEFDYFPGIAALSTQNRAVGQKMSAGLRGLLGGGAAQDGVQDVLDKTGVAAVAHDAAFLDQLFQPEVVRAQVETLSDQMRVLGVDTVDLLKIDTEGAEREVLAGLAAEDWPKIRQMLIEVHLGEQVLAEMAADLRRRGFTTSLGRHPLCRDGAEVFHIYAAR
ncbi:FkbM family methyltransferase [Magnetospirillum sulfuroxidans]|uniref:FkbM family methyltransferase n=1 Tax=Magnetospirillum sulfuroxidans TaxID=611300 RepID=A0ABS5I7C3_9PROT|nr:FkbM family methyltransferase [Magnetospirillum sulfuroxidans]MBR9970330.1 FkbM family methyltransferase [Magnetospirillum sulfuroxidans]